MSMTSTRRQLITLHRRLRGGRSEVIVRSLCHSVCLFSCSALCLRQQDRLSADSCLLHVCTEISADAECRRAGCITSQMCGGQTDRRTDRRTVLCLLDRHYSWVRQR